MKKPCVGSPCSPSISPWSPTTTTTVSVEAAVGAQARRPAARPARPRRRSRRRRRRPWFAGTATARARAPRTACARRRDGPRRRSGWSRSRLQPLERAIDDVAIPAAGSCPSPPRPRTGRDRTRRSSDRSPARSPSADRARTRRRSRRFESPCSRRTSASVTLIVVQVEAAVVAHAVPAGKRAGHERGMRGQRQRHHGRRLLEAQAGARQRVDPRRLRGGVPIAAETIRADGVERDEQQVARTRQAREDRPGTEPPTGDPAARPARRGRPRSTRCASHASRPDDAAIWSSRTRHEASSLRPPRSAASLRSSSRAGAEVGRELQRLFERRPRLSAAALADEDEPEIEVIAMIRAVARDRLRETPLRLRSDRPLPPSVMPSAFQADAFVASTATASRRRGERRVDLAEIALQLAEPLADRARPWAAAAGRTCNAATASPGRRRRRHSVCLEHAPAARRPDSVSGPRERSPAPPQVQLSPDALRPNRSTPLRAAARAAPPARNARAARSARFSPASDRARYRCASKLSMPRPINSSNARAAAAYSRRFNARMPVAHAFVGAPELENLVLRIGARRRRRRRVVPLDIAEGAEPLEQIRPAAFGLSAVLRDAAFLLEHLRERAPKGRGARRLLAPRGCVARADPPPGRRARASGRSTYFHDPRRSTRRSLHPKCSSGTSDSAYWAVGRRRRSRLAARRRGCCRTAESRVGGPTPSRSSAVGSRSTSPTLAAIRPPRAIARAAHDERHGESRLIDEEAVERLFMLAEPLAVIRGHGEQRLRLEAKPLERVVQLTDERIGVRHLAVVRSIAIARRVGFGRLVRIVRLEQMEPQEDAVGRALAFEPRGLPPAACRRPASATCSGGRRSWVFGKSSSYRSKPRPNPPRRSSTMEETNARGAKARAFQDFGEERRWRKLGRRQVVAHAQLPRQQAREDGGVGRARQRDVGHRVGRIRPLARDPIESGRQIDAAVDADAVGAQRIDVTRTRWRASPAGAARCTTRRAQSGEQRRDQLAAIRRCMAALESRHSHGGHRIRGSGQAKTAFVAPECSRASVDTTDQLTRSTDASRDVALMPAPTVVAHLCGLP